jgi:hypothetical protein
MGGNPKLEIRMSKQIQNSNVRNFKCLLFCSVIAPRPPEARRSGTVVFTENVVTGGTIASARQSVEQPSSSPWTMQYTS